MMKVVVVEIKLVAVKGGGSYEYWGGDEGDFDDENTVGCKGGGG